MTDLSKWPTDFLERARARLIDLSVILPIEKAKTALELAAAIEAELQRRQKED